MHQELERQAVAAAAVPSPVGQQVRRVGRIADGADVRSRVADAADGVRIGQHLADHIQAAAGVVLEGIQEQGVAITVREQVQCQLPRADAQVCSAGCHRGTGIGLVVGHVAELERTRERVVHPLAEPVRRPVFNQRPTQALVVAHAGGSLRRGQMGDLPVGRVIAEGIHRHVESEHDADGSAADLPIRGNARSVGGTDVIEGFAPELRCIVDLQQQH